jgi:hypothetical protein
LFNNTQRDKRIRVRHITAVSAMLLRALKAGISAQRRIEPMV